MLTLADYWMGRDKTHGLELDTQTRRNAASTIDLADRLLILAKTHGVTLETNPRTRSIVNSGWREVERVFECQRCKIDSTRRAHGNLLQRCMNASRMCSRREAPAIIEFCRCRTSAPSVGGGDGSRK